MRILGFVAVSIVIVLSQSCTTSGSMSVGSQYNFSSVHRHSVAEESVEVLNFTNRSSSIARQNHYLSITGP